MAIDVETRILTRKAEISELGGISMAGYIRNSRGVGPRPMRVLGSYALVYLLEGGGRYGDANGHEQAIVPGDLIFVFPNLAHRYGPREGQVWTEIYFIFAGPVFELWERTALLDPRRPVSHAEPIEYWLPRFESVVGSPRLPGNPQAPPLLEVCRLQEVLSEALIGGQQGPDEEADMKWAARACAMLEAELSRDLDVPRIARRLGMSYEGFRKRFTRLMGMPPNRYRAKRVIDRACELMHRGSMTDKQIAATLGFCDEFHFSKRFKQIAGCSPRAFRARLPLAS
jgi:AraC-like DNA-binding protein